MQVLQNDPGTEPRNIRHEIQRLLLPIREELTGDLMQVLSSETG